MHDCQEFRGCRIKKGYGQVNMNGRTVYAHRLAYALHYGEDPTGKCVLHKCDNPPCVNPDHLFLGTQADNVRDMWAKGRARPGGDSKYANKKRK